jgi:hypothetical protein
VDKQNVVYSYKEIPFNLKEELILTNAATWKNLRNTGLTKRSQT